MWLELRKPLLVEIDLNGAISNLEDGAEGAYNFLDVIREISLVSNRVELQDMKLQVEADLLNVYAHVRGFVVYHSDLAWDEYVHIFWGQRLQYYWRITREECLDGAVFNYIDYYENLERLRCALRREYGPEVADKIVELAQRLRGPEEVEGK
jgi:hypothetical protein